MEAAIRWSPQSTPDDGRFLIADVAGNRFRHCRVTSVNRKRVEYEVIGKRDNVSNYTAFDWYRNHESLVVTADGFGATRVVRLEAGDGPPSDYVKVFKIKQERKSNSIALSQNGLIATAYDKARTDPSLNVYDLEQYSGSDPLRRLANADAVANVKWFPHQPDLLLAGTVQSKQGALLRLYDLRDSSSTASTAVNTRHCHLLSIDPLDENYFASAGPTGDPVVSIWDRRALSSSISSSTTDILAQSSVLEIRPAIATSSQAHIWSLRYSGYRRGCFAVLSSVGQVKCFETARFPSDDDSSSEDEPETSDATHWVKKSHELQKPRSNEMSKVGTTRTMAFDFVGPHCLTAESSILSVRSNMTLEVIEIAFDVDLPPVAKRQNVVKERCMQGYVTDCEKNQQTLRKPEDDGLIEMWDTIGRMNDLAEDDGMFHQALDLSFLGVHDIWNGILGPNPNRVSRLFSRSSKPSTQSEFTNAVRSILRHHGYGQFEGVQTEYPSHRQLCLAVCGWSFLGQRLRDRCKEVFEAGQKYKAVFYAMMHERRDIAIEMLRDASKDGFSEHVGLAVLIAGSPLTSQQLELTSWMIEEATDPYLKALLKYHVTGKDSVLGMQELPLTFRVAIAIKNLSDKDLSSYLDRETQAAIASGSADGIIVTGLAETSMDLFQNYISKTSDLQTAVLATAYTNPRLVDDPRFEHWRTTYTHTLQRWRAFRQRVRFDGARLLLARSRDGKSLVQPLPNQMSLRCNNCHANPARRPPLNERDLRRNSSDLSIADDDSTSSASGFNQRSPAAAAGTICFNCGRPLPRCSICMMHLGAPDPIGRGDGRIGKWKPTEAEQEALRRTKGFNQLVVFCVMCGHGAHAHEAKEWFRVHRVCPEEACACLCSD